METRTRSRRNNPPASTAPQPKRPQRKKRQGSRAVSETAGEPPSGSIATNGRDADSVLGSFVTLPIPRRGAPRKNSLAPSVASVPTRSGAESEDELESDSDATVLRNGPSQAVIEVANREVVVTPEHLATPVEDDDRRSEDENDGDDDASIDEELSLEVRTGVMAANIEDLSQASKNLLRLLVNSNHSDRVYRATLKLKRNAFANIREIYEAPESDTAPTAPFIGMHALGEDQAAINILLTTNLTTIINGCDLLQHNRTFERLVFLETLDDTFPLLLSEVPDSKHGRRIGLNIRVQHLVEMIGARQSLTFNELRALMISVFCLPSQKRMQLELLSSGPFKPLRTGDSTVLGQQSDEMLVSSALHAIINSSTKLYVEKLGKGAIKADKPLKDLDELSDTLRQLHPLDVFIGNLSGWVLKVAELSDTSGQNLVGLRSPQPAFVGDSQDNEDDGSVRESQSQAESQQIVPAKNTQGYDFVQKIH